MTGRTIAAMDPTAPITALRGIGPSGAEALAARGVTRVADLPFVVPIGFDDLRAPLGVAEARAKAHERPRVALRGVVRSASMAFVRGRQSVRVVVAGEAPAPGKAAPVVTAWWFFAAHGILAVAKPGRRVVLAGRLAPTRRGDGVAMSHPDLFADEDGAPLGVRPRYARMGIAPARLRKAIGDAIDALGEPPDPVPPIVVEREGMPRLAPLFVRIHRPETPPDATSIAALGERLAWAEAFGRAWERAVGEAAVAGLGAPRLARAPAAVERLRLELWFEWTGGQRAAIEAIASDLEGDRPMRRLLFGDVGSGKTAVALAAAAQTAAGGAQTAILAPTSVLAEQYLDAAGPLARATGARIALLTSETRAAERRHLLRAIADGTLDVVVGTHALLGDDVRFRRLGFVVVDEQQRLGVAQRLSLVRKGEGGEQATRPHLLTLSATPIPRTLALAIRGELATSELSERPPGRRPVATDAIARVRWDEVVVPAIRAAIDAGGRAFVVCPRIGGDEDEDGSIEVGPSCIERAEMLGTELGEGRVVLAHGAMRPSALSAAMRKFRDGSAPVLVGTTVVEVGVDVPEATLMVIDGAEHFGLAQLHQLRGRVGRGVAKSRCLLVHDAPLAPAQTARIDALTKLERGLDVAREDLRLRGSGDLGGTRQSGDEGLVWLDPLAEPPWLARIGDDVNRLRRDDPDLARPEHLGLRLAIERMRRELAVREEAG